MAKRSAKQRANDKRLGKLARSRGKKSRPKSRTKSIIRTVSKVARKRIRSKKSSGFKMPGGLGGLIGNVGYGFIRERLSDQLSQLDVVQRLPVTEFTDEGVMLGVNFALRKFGLGKVPIVGNLLRAQKTIEQARIGQTLSDMQGQNNGSGNSKGIFIN